MSSRLTIFAPLCSVEGALCLTRATGVLLGRWGCSLFSPVLALRQVGRMAVGCISIMHREDTWRTRHLAGARLSQQIKGFSVWTDSGGGGGGGGKSCSFFPGSHTPPLNQAGRYEPVCRRLGRSQLAGWGSSSVGRGILLGFSFVSGEWRTGCSLSRSRRSRRSRSRSTVAAAVDELACTV